MTLTSRAPRLTAPQLEILRVLWERSEATVVEIHRALHAERPLAATTIATLLSRLEKRGLVAYRTEGRQYVYRAVLQEQDARQHALVEVTRGLFAGDVPTMVSQLLSSHELRPGDLARVRAADRGEGTGTQEEETLMTPADLDAAAAVVALVAADLRHSQHDPAGGRGRRGLAVCRSACVAGSDLEGRPGRPTGDGQPAPRPHCTAAGRTMGDAECDDRDGHTGGSERACGETPITPCDTVERVTSSPAVERSAESDRAVPAPRTRLDLPASGASLVAIDRRSGVADHRRRRRGAVRRSTATASIGCSAPACR